MLNLISTSAFKLFNDQQPFTSIKQAIIVIIVWNSLRNMATAIQSVCK